MIIIATTAAVFFRTLLSRLKSFDDPTRVRPQKRTTLRAYLYETVGSTCLGVKLLITRTRDAGRREIPRVLRRPRTSVRDPSARSPRPKRVLGHIQRFRVTCARN